MNKRANRLGTKSNVLRPSFFHQWAIGISDGLILPFAVATGICTATQNNSMVILISFTVMCGAALFLGLGGYFAEKTGQLLFSDVENAGSAKFNEFEKNEIEESRKLLKSIELDEEIQKHAAIEISGEHNRWATLKNNYGLRLTLSEPTQPLKSAIHIVIAYMAGGLIPLFPFIFSPDANQALRYSVMVTLICQFVFGYIKSESSSMPPVIGGIRMVFIGAAASGAAFAIAIAIGKV